MSENVTKEFCKNTKRDFVEKTVKPLEEKVADDHRRIKRIEDAMFGVRGKPGMEEMVTTLYQVFNGAGFAKKLLTYLLATIGAIIAIILGLKKLF